MGILARITQTDRFLMTLIFPHRTYCLSCGKLSLGQPLCPACMAEMDALRLSGDLCPLCGHALTASPCSFCHSDMPGRMYSVWRHTGAPRQLVLRLKHTCVAEAASVLAPSMAEVARKLDYPPDTVITWVTMPRSRRRRRGIDHSRLLAQALAHELRLPCRQLLSRLDMGKTQRGLSRRQRLRNLQGMFSCPAPLNHPVLLVDDVTTTSATARTCAQVLLAAGTTQVMIVTATQA